MENKETILKVENVRQYFKVGSGRKKLHVKAIHNISFEIKKGEVIGLVGESGCGKTTTGRSIIGLYNITDGKIYFDNKLVNAGTRSLKISIKEKKKEIKAKIQKINEAFSKQKQEILSQNQSTMFLVKEKKQEINEKIKVANENIAELQEKIKKDTSTIEEVNVYKVELKELMQYKKTLKSELEDFIKKNENVEVQKHSNEKPKDKNKINQRLKEIRQDRHNQCSVLYKEYHAFKKLQKIEIKKTRYLFSEAYQEFWSKEKRSFIDHLVYLFSLRVYAMQNTRNQREHMKKMQMIFQDPISSLDPRMTVMEIIAEGLRIRGIKDKKIIEEKVFESLKMVGLVPEHASRYPHEFSGGQRQRIGIARALVASPDLIIADEPISALDVSIQAQVMNLLNDLKKNLNLTILFIAHDLSVVKYFCDRIYVMYNGRIVEIADSEELFKNPLHPYTRSLLSAIPLPDPEYEKNRIRKPYIPSKEHKWSNDKPEMIEILPNHFVYGRPEEIVEYKKLIK